MVYHYTVYTLDRRIVQGTIDATSASMAEEALYRAGYDRVLTLREVRPRPSLGELVPILFGVKTEDVIDFSHQLATLTESGITILSALQLLGGQPSKPALRRMIAGLVDELRGGSSFSQALSKYPQVFSFAYCQVMKASEQAGDLEGGLRQIAGYMEKQAATKQRVTRAMIYPALVLLMAMGVSALLITVVLPPLIKLFASFGAELPLATRVLIATANFLISYKLYLLGGLFALVAAIVGYVRLPAGKLTMNRLMLRMPVISPINIQRNMGHFCRTTSMLLKAGLQLPQVIDIIAQTLGNRVIRQALRDVREGLVQGQGLSQAMGAIDLFPRLLVEAVAVGEKTGNMEGTLATLADFYEQRVDRRIDTLTSLIEPSLTVVVGLVVAFIALSMITPLYSILESIK